MTEESMNEPSTSGAASGQENEPLAQAVDPPDGSQAPRSLNSTPAAAGGANEPIRLEVSALSDIGCVRSNNEDAFGYDEALGIFVVCDGVGGMASGEVASSRAVAAIVQAYADSASSEFPVSSRLMQAINAANLDVWESGQAPENKGMGTTAVAAAVDGNKLILGNVGDSRAYIIQGGQCIQLTVDHTFINELIRNGTLTIESARKADLRGMESVITRAVGIANDVEPDFFSVVLKPGSTILLATDGLTRYLQQEEIAAILAASPFQSACANLIGVAKERGGQDNITCVLLRVLDA